MGAFPASNREAMLRVIRNHSARPAKSEGYEDLAIAPVAPMPRAAPTPPSRARRAGIVPALAGNTASATRRFR
jgi:hypothetical protein